MGAVAREKDAGPTAVGQPDRAEPLAAPAFHPAGADTAVRGRETLDADRPRKLATERPETCLLGLPRVRHAGGEVGATSNRFRL